MQKENIVELLNELLTKAYDAEQGFKKAAELSEGQPKLATFFRQQSDLRLTFGHDIKKAITLHGGEPDKGSSMAAKAHQVWITVKDKLTANDDGEAILEECVRGEKAAIKEYDKKLETPDLPSDVVVLMTGQRSRIADSLVEVAVLEKRTD